jgi:hypothetical protein
MRCVALRPRPDRTASSRNNMFAGRRLSGSRTCAVDDAGAWPARTHERSGRHRPCRARTRNPCAVGRCSPERWAGDSSPGSTVFPTDSAGAPWDSWREKGRPRPPSASKHGDTPSYMTAICVVSDRTAPQHHGTRAALWFHSQGFQTLDYRQGSFFEVRRVEIEHGWRESRQPSRRCQVIRRPPTSPLLNAH